MSSSSADDLGPPVPALHHDEEPRRDEGTANEQPQTPADVPSRPRGGACKKRRAALACLACRKRKVRCNILQQSPCSNCVWDKAECHVAKTRRRRQLALHFEQNPQGGMTQPPSFPAGATSHESHLEAPKHPDPSRDDVRSLGQTQPPRQEHPQEPAEKTYSHHQEPPPAPGPIREEAVSHLIKPVLSRVGLEDAVYLGLKGALNIPEKLVSLAFLDCFRKYVHPNLPVIDIDELSRVVTSHFDDPEPSGAPGATQEESPIASLLLVQAVMFAATAFVEAEHLRSMGFASRRIARKCFYDRAKLLYNLDCEQDSFVNAQALLLMTFWHDTLDDEKDASHWIGVVLDLMDSVNHKTLPPPKLQLWRRIQWCCLVRDSLVSLGMRRPMKMAFSQWEDLELDLDTFDVASPDVANLFIARCRLCLIISQILETQYVVENRKPVSTGYSSESTMLMYPRRSPDPSAVESLDQALAEWQSSLPDCYRIRPSLQTPDFRDDAHSGCLLRQSIVQMEYEVVVATLYRPTAQAAPEAFSPENLASRVAAYLRTLQAAQNISVMASDLDTLGLGKFLPSSALTVLVPCMMTLIVDWKTNEASYTTMKHIQSCYKLLEILRDMYNAADVGEGLVRLALGSDASMLDQQLPMPAGPPSLQSAEDASPSGSSDIDMMNLAVSAKAPGICEPCMSPGNTWGKDDAMWPELADWGSLNEEWSALCVP